MEALLKIWKTSRQVYAGYLDNYTLEQLNKIPEGFNNNLIWNIGHVVVAQQSLIYKLSDLQMYISDELFERYKPGTKPTETTSLEEVEELRHLLNSLVEKTETDLKAGRFVTFQERMTRIGFLLTSLDEALEFVNYHEGIHLGYMMSIRKFV